MNNTVLVFSGLDPCGGAGISADIETIAQFGLTPLPIISALTVQNTCSVAQINAIDAELIAKQFYHLQADIVIDTIKIGLLASIAQIRIIAKLIKNKTVILDPIIQSSAKDTLLNTQEIAALKKYLLPLVHILTPNAEELFILSAGANEQQRVASLPCKWVLVTTTDISDSSIEHRLYQYGELVKHYCYNKLPEKYHGSGCTLASSIAALIAQGLTTDAACQQALDYTYQTLLNAKRIGKMQLHPNRCLAAPLKLQA